MPQITLWKRFIALISFVVCLSAEAAPNQSVNYVSFKKIDNYKIIVSITINGSAPLDMMLDTGSNVTIIDEKLADDLNLPKIAVMGATGVGWQADMMVVRADSISMSGSTVHSVGISVSKHLRNLPGKVRGILGEDFLHHFDVLIDYRNHSILLATSDLLSETLQGEKLPVRLQSGLGSDAVSNRLIVEAHAAELGDKRMSLQLDSGANKVYLFGGPQTLGSRAVAMDCAVTSGFNSDRQTTTNSLEVRALQFGNKALSHVTLYAPPAVPNQDADGLMPLSMFHAIFISHSGAYVILDPALKPASETSLLASR